MFNHLHLHSHYSLLEAIGKPKNIIKKIQDHGMTACALTDYHSMYGAVSFYEQCLKADIKPLLGVDIAIVPDRHDKSNKKEKPGTITLLAKNYDGYQDLLKLVSEANMAGFHIKPRIDFDLLQQYNKNLIGYMGGPYSYIGKLIINNEDQGKLEEIIKRFQSIFGKEHFYLEYTAQDYKNAPSCEKINKNLENLASATSTPCICSPNVHYIEKEDKKPFEVALAIKDGKRVYDEDKRKVIGDRYCMSEQEVTDTMLQNGYTSEAIEAMYSNIQAIVDTIDISLPLDTILFPNYESSEKVKKRYEEVKDILIEKV